MAGRAGFFFGKQLRSLDCLAPGVSNLGSSAASPSRSLSGKAEIKARVSAQHETRTLQSLLPSVKALGGGIGMYAGLALATYCSGIAPHILTAMGQKTNALRDHVL